MVVYYGVGELLMEFPPGSEGGGEDWNGHSSRSHLAEIPATIKFVP
jgi:hypothetical protein